MSQSHTMTSQSTAEAVRRVAQAVAASDFRRASELADTALSSGLIHPAFLNARALWLERQGRDEDALESFRQARALAPKDAHVLNAIGLALTRLFRLDEAIETFDEAIRVAPAYAVTHQRRAVALGLAGRIQEAERAHTRAIQLDPRNVEALATLASLEARRGKADSAASYAKRALAIDPGNATAHAALALLDLSQGNFVAAERRLKPLVDDSQLVGHGRAVVLGLLGDSLDGQDRTAEAFDFYLQANNEQKKLHAARFEGKPGVGSAVEDLLAYAGAASEDLWHEPTDRAESGPEPVGHIFLLGFHRSGTTLLEQALESHPEIVTLDERDFLSEPAARYLSSSAALATLATADAAELAVARAAYWKRVREHGLHTDGKVFVDKHPFNTIKLPLILKLFPDAKVIFALRDPRDVVWSCFRRHFDVDLVKYEFLSLGSAARLYDRVMQLGALCREKRPGSFFQHRYEDLVEDFEGRMRAVGDFIGVAWSDSMRDFAAAARSLDAYSASAQQVQRGLYAEGVGHWRRYRSELTGVLPILKPWVERYGYSAD